MRKMLLICTNIKMIGWELVLVGDYYALNEDASFIQKSQVMSYLNIVDKNTSGKIIPVKKIIAISLPTAKPPWLNILHFIRRSRGKSTSFYVEDSTANPVLVKM